MPARENVRRHNAGRIDHSGVWQLLSLSIENGRGSMMDPGRYMNVLISGIMNGTLFAAVVATGLLCGVQANAQLIRYHFEPDHQSLSTNVPLNEINARAFRNFVKSFGNVAGSVWRKQREGYSASFYTADSVLYVSHYSSHGRPNGVYVYYTGTNAPAEVRSDMAYLYARDRILYVDEFRNGEQSLFEIGLEEGSQLRVVRERQGEIKTVDLFTRYSEK